MTERLIQTRDCIPGRRAGPVEFPFKRIALFRCKGILHCKGLPVLFCVPVQQSRHFDRIQHLYSGSRVELFEDALDCNEHFPTGTIQSAGDENARSGDDQVLRRRAPNGSEVFDDRGRRILIANYRRRSQINALVGKQNPSRGDGGRAGDHRW